MKKIIALLLFISVTAWSATIDRPVKIISFAPAGSGPDSVMRKLAEQLTAKWHQPVIIENKPGGNGQISLEAFVNEPQGSLTLYLGDISSIVLSPLLYKTNTPIGELYPLIGILRANMFMITKPSITNLAELKESLVNKPSYGSWGTGSTPHFLGLELSTQVGIDATHIPYKDYGQWFIDVANGELTYSFATVASANKLVKLGKLQYFAVAAPQRDPAFPNVPTVQELTGKKIDYLRPWAAIYSKPSVPADINKQMEKDITEVFNSPEIQMPLRAMDYPSTVINGTSLQKFIADEVVMYTKLFKDFDITSK